MSLLPFLMGGFSWADRAWPSESFDLLMSTFGFIEAELIYFSASWIKL